jgi:transposase
MKNYGEVFVGIDKAKKKHAVAIADAGRDGETRYLGKVNSAPAMAERVIKKLASKCAKVRVWHEAGPTGYGLALDHECTVVAPLMLQRSPEIGSRPTDAMR